MLFVHRDDAMNKLRRIYEIYRGSYLIAHGLLNLLNDFGKRYKMRSLPSILSLFRNELFGAPLVVRQRIKTTPSTNVRFDLSHDIKITLKSHFWRIILSL